MKATPNPLKKTGILALTVLVIVVGFILMDIKSYSHIVQLNGGNKNMVPQGEIVALSTSNSMVYYWENMMLEAQSNRIRVSNIGGDAVWGQQLPTAASKIIHVGSNVAVLDSSKTLYYYSKQGKLLWTYALPFEVNDVFADEKGLLLLEYKGDQGNTVEVLNAKGTRIANIMIENASILSFTVNEGNNFSISVIDVSGDTVKCKIMTYNGKGELIWADNYDNKIIPMIRYNRNNALVAVGEDSLSLYRQDGKRAGTVDLKRRLLHVAVGENAVVTISQDKGKYLCSSFDLKLKKGGSIFLDKQPEGLYVHNSKFILYDRDSVAVYNLKGEILSTYKKTMDISRVYMTDENTIYIVSNRKLQKLIIE